MQFYPEEGPTVQVYQTPEWENFFLLSQCVHISVSLRNNCPLKISSVNVSKDTRS